VNRIQVGEANLHVAEVQAQVADEVNTAVQIARARREVLDTAQDAVVQASETFRKLEILQKGRIGHVAAEGVDSLEPVIAVQTLAQARDQYLNAVIDYNRAQFQLFTAMGRPSLEALPKATVTPVEVPVVPAPYQPPRPQPPK